MAAFWLAILLQLLFSMWLGLTPIGAKISVAFADTPVFSWVVHADVV
jgi:ABC-type dipeptide/oligopeptide/nickel transport system permease component